MLLLVLDLAHPEGITPEQQEAVLLDELERYSPELAERPRLRALSRADLVSDRPAAGADDLIISAVTGEGIPQLLGALRRAVDGARAAAAEPDAYVVHRPVPEGIAVERGHDGVLEVLGRDARRAVALSDLTNADAMAVARERLTALGVDRALARAGARPGDIVRIGDLELTYESDDVVVGEGDDR